MVLEGEPQCVIDSHLRHGLTSQLHKRSTSRGLV
jgi:hypothetical protein